MNIIVNDEIQLLTWIGIYIILVLSIVLLIKVWQQ